MDDSASRCGQFDEAYIEALKGVRFCLPSPTNTNYYRMDRFIYTSFIKHRDLPTQFTKTYPILFSASHPGTSYYGPPTYRVLIVRQFFGYVRVSDKAQPGEMGNQYTIIAAKRAGLLYPHLRRTLSR
jgi:hypothetical protein